MEDASFTAVALRLKDMEAGQLLGELQKMFFCIAEFTPEQAISHYQALALSGEILGQGGAAVIAHFKRAIVLKMRQIVSETGDKDLQRALEKRFIEAIGGYRFWSVL